MANNLFKGKDKDILKAMDWRTNHIVVRDSRAAAGVLKPSLSSMELIIDPNNENVTAAFITVHAFVTLLMERIRPLT